VPAVKKDPSVRARRNVASTRTTLPRDRGVVVVPVMPARSEGNEWHDEVIRWWDAVWSSPMASQWDVATDRYNVIMAAMHLNDVWMATSASARQKADAAFSKRVGGLGLSPYDRRRLEWTLMGDDGDVPVSADGGEDPVDEVPDEPVVEKSPVKKREPAVDPRALLASAS
jgi:hypothetical protein